MTMHPRTVAQISSAATKARDKHPWPPGDDRTARYTMLAALLEEAGEVAQALLDGNDQAYQHELLDTAAVIVRMIEGC